MSVLETDDDSALFQPPKFHTNPWVQGAEPSALKYVTRAGDTVQAHYKDGHTATFTDRDGGHRTRRTLYPGGDKTERKIDGLVHQLYHRESD